MAERVTQEVHDAIAGAADAAGRDDWRRCVCDQFGRCLTDCPSAELERPGVGWYWNVALEEWVLRG